jgi:hypothetical protein
MRLQAQLFETTARIIEITETMDDIVERMHRKLKEDVPDATLLLPQPQTVAEDDDLVRRYHRRFPTRSHGDIASALDLPLEHVERVLGSDLI